MDHKYIRIIPAWIISILVGLPQQAVWAEPPSHLFDAPQDLNSSVKTLDILEDFAGGKTPWRAPFEEHSGNYGSLDFDAYREFDLLRITSDALPGEGNMKVLMDDQSNFAALRYYSMSGKMLNMSPDELAKGVVLMSQHGSEVIRLKAESLSATQGGKFVLTYTTNGITHTYADFIMHLNRSGNQPGTEVPGAGRSGRGLYPDPRYGRDPLRPEGRSLPSLDDWVLRTSEGQAFTQMFVKAKFMFGQAIGIESIEVH